MKDLFEKLLNILPALGRELVMAFIIITPLSYTAISLIVDNADNVIMIDKVIYSCALSTVVLFFSVVSTYNNRLYNAYLSLILSIPYCITIIFYEITVEPIIFNYVNPNIYVIFKLVLYAAILFFICYKMGKFLNEKVK